MQIVNKEQYNIKRLHSIRQQFTIVKYFILITS